MTQQNGTSEPEKKKRVKILKDSFTSKKSTKTVTQKATFSNGCIHSQFQQAKEPFSGAKLSHLKKKKKRLKERQLNQDTAIEGQEIAGTLLLWDGEQITYLVALRKSSRGNKGDGCSLPNPLPLQIHHSGLCFNPAQTQMFTFAFTVIFIEVNFQSFGVNCNMTKYGHMLVSIFDIFISQIGNYYKLLLFF